MAKESSDQNAQNSNKKNKKWYQHGWGLLAAILLLPFFIIWYAWSESNWSKNVKIGATALGVVLIMFSMVLSASTPDTPTSTNDTNQSEQEQEQPDQEVVTKEAEPEPEVMSPQEKMFESVSSLIDSKQAFDTGSYVKGDIPKGEYAFISFEGSGKYYSEEDAAGNIIDNENFDSFGYVYVHAAGNITTQGVLIKTDAVKQLEAKGAKEIYEKLNNVKDYKGAGWYKVGSDISPGQYTIESLGSGYVAVLSGPVGNNNIIDNNNFNGKYSVSVQKGQYLKVQSGEIK